MLKRFAKYFIGLAAIASSSSVTTAAGAADLGLTAPPQAVGRCADIVFQCEDGREYPLCPIALSVAGEVVTATLRTSPGNATYVRLVPMGVGYRYAGKGLWLDGLEDQAVLNVGDRPLACSVIR